MKRETTLALGDIIELKFWRGEVYVRATHRFAEASPEAQKNAVGNGEV